MRKQREERQSLSRRVQETEGGETIPEKESSGNRGRRDNPREGELRKQRVERQSLSRRVEETEGGETIPE